MLNKILSRRVSFYNQPCSFLPVKFTFLQRFARVCFHVSSSRTKTVVVAVVVVVVVVVVVIVVFMLERSV